MYTFFTGETSAGKSSFLNLLLGEDILPVHHNPCTSVITKISYGAKRQARIIHMDGTTEDIEGIHKGELKERLWNKIYETDLDSREKKSPTSEVQLSLPISLLKVCGKKKITNKCRLMYSSQIKVGFNPQLI